MYDRERPAREIGGTFPPQRRKTPSFSSSLLDSIYRSIDESGPKDQSFELCSEAPSSRNAGTRKQSSCGSSQQPTTTLRRAISVDDWMEKQSPTLHCNLNSASISSSSDSSSGATFSSSSEAESCRFSKPRPRQAGFGKSFDLDSAKKIEPDAGGSSGGLSKTKLRALKIYGELKSLKQPISPGGRISSFLNSIFNSGNVKKAKMCYVGAVEDVSFERKSKSASASACSSASSFSRRYKTETPTTTTSSSSSSSFQSRNKMKRSVRFYPVSVIVGEDSRPCGHKPVYQEEDPTLLPLPARRVKDVKTAKSSPSASARDRGRRARFQEYDEEEEEEEEEDAESCASSDLFELDHLMGIGRYREELPVYETTCLKKNQAIASGMML